MSSDKCQPVRHIDPPCVVPFSPDGSVELLAVHSTHCNWREFFILFLPLNQAAYDSGMRRCKKWTANKNQFLFKCLKGLSEVEEVLLLTTYNWYAHFCTFLLNFAILTMRVRVVRVLLYLITEKKSSDFKSNIIEATTCTKLRVTL